MGDGLILAAPASDSGKTTLTLALLRAYANRGVEISSAKIGPDFIDPAFHTAASRRPCTTLDSWAMSSDLFADQVARAAAASDLLIAEGVMGLFDGTEDTTGSTAHVAKLTGWPVILVIDAAGMAASVAALLQGFASYDPDVTIAGVIFNRVGSERHARLLAKAVDHLSIPVIGWVQRAAELELPARHLGLVQAAEHRDLERFLEVAAKVVTRNLDTGLLSAIARPATTPHPVGGVALTPLGQRIAVACDDAFSFAYEFILDGWRRVGAEVSCFSPLADQAPTRHADAIYLPGGYPELHAGALSKAGRFLGALREAAASNLPIFGECGGYMVLGETLQDATGKTHAMAGLLPVATSFKQRRLTLGYRQLRLRHDCVLGRAGDWFRGHEFHFSTRVGDDETERALFSVYDANATRLGRFGCKVGSVIGSYMHLMNSTPGLRQAPPACRHEVCEG